MPKLLVLDIETAPAIAYVWRLYDENIGLDQLIQPSRVISVGAKFVGESKTYYWDVLDGRKEMLEGIRALIAEADAVITYNGDKFDLPKLTGEFIEQGVPLPPPVTSIDVIKTVKKLGLQSARLAFAVPYFKLGSKGKTDFRLWRKFMEGDPVARTKMRFYNLRDVTKLERLYKKLRPAITQHPTLFRGHSICGKCGHKAQHRGYRYTKAFKIERISCIGGCGSWTDGGRSKR